MSASSKPKVSYLDAYKRSIEQPQDFWAEAAQDVTWSAPWDVVVDP